MRTTLKFVVLLTIFTLFGCGLTAIQQEGVARFAKASSGLGEFSATTLSEFRKATIEMNTKNIAIGGTATINDLDESFDAEDISARISAATALSSYGQLLLALVENTQEAELKQASDKFVDSFKNVSNKKLSDTQLDSLGTVVQGIGGLIVEHKKAHAVKKIVLDTQGDVDVVCDLLIADFGSTGLGLGQGLNVTIKRLKGDADIALAQTNNFQDRLIAIEGYRLAETNKAKLDTVVKKARQLLIDLKKANSQLAGALQDDKQSISDIRAMGAKFKELHDALRLFTTM